MSMGYGANYADVISAEFIEKTCPKEFKAFNDVFQDAVNFGLNELSEYEIYNFLRSKEVTKDVLPIIKELVGVYTKLQRAFKKITGLTLSMEWHDSEENGDTYDEVNGFFWCVDGVFQFTPAGKKYKRYITRSFYVTYG